jgi:hypothetical protein
VLNKSGLDGTTGLLIFAMSANLIGCFFPAETWPDPTGGSSVGDSSVGGSSAGGDGGAGGSGASGGGGVASTHKCGDGMITGPEVCDPTPDDNTDGALLIAFAGQR